MCILNHTTDQRKRLGCANPNLINQVELNPQINENNPMYKKLMPKSKITAKKKLTNEKDCYIILLWLDHVAIPRESLYHGPI
jgi:hypothetical protein